MGLTRYFSGSTCIRGHIAERSVSRGVCLSCAAQKKSEWQQKNRPRLLEYKRERYRATFNEKRDSRNAATAAWQRNNRDKANAKDARRRAAELRALPAWFGELDALVMLEASDLAARREVATGVRWHVDHMIPLRAKYVSGLHCAANLQVIPGVLNQSKGNRMLFTRPLEWLGAV